MVFVANDCFMQAPADKLLKVFRIYNKAAIEVCIGQQLDMDYEKAAIVSQEEYLRMIELKTAVLVAASVKTGAVIGGANDKDSELLYEFGRNLGLAFQVQDDLLDIGLPLDQLRIGVSHHLVDRIHGRFRPLERVDPDPIVSLVPADAANVGERTMSRAI